MLKISLEETVAGIRTLDDAAMAAARARQDELIKPRGSLGMLEDISVQLAGMFGRNKPSINAKVHILAAGDHGVVAEGVSAYPQEVTAQMVMNFLAGGAAINVLARHAGARVIVVDAGINAELPPHPELISMPAGRGTANMMRGPAMSREQARLCIENGISIAAREVEGGADIIGTGDMGIGNTTAASAVTSAICNVDPIDVTGLGAGIAEDQREHKADVIRKAVELNRPDATDGLDVLAKVGGFEIGFLTGVMLGTAAAGRPVLIDGFISGAAALIAYTIRPDAKQYMIASHLSVERGHGHALRHIGLKPILDLGMRLGEGTGAALAMLVVEAAAKCLAEMPTFAEAGVSDKE